MKTKTRVHFIVGLILVSIFFGRMEIFSNQEKRIYVLFRLDDYSSKSLTAFDLKVIESFKKRNLSCTFGVIPFDKSGNTAGVPTQDPHLLSAEKAAILRDAVKHGTVEAAMHGVFHDQVARDKTFGAGEFLTLDYEHQLGRILEGKKFLERMLREPVDIFIPPYNAYDSHTIKALEKAGFSILSADVFGPAGHDSRLKFVPETTNLLRLREAIQATRKGREPSSLITVLFHLSDFEELERREAKLSYPEFEDLLSWVSEQKDVRVIGFKEAVQLLPNLDAERFMTYQKFFRIYATLPEFLRPFSKSVYWSQPTLSRFIVVGWTLLLAFYLVLFAFSICVARFLVSVRFMNSRAAQFGAQVLLVLLLGHIVYDRNMGRMDGIALVFLAGFCLSLWSLRLLRRQNREHQLSNCR